MSTSELFDLLKEAQRIALEKHGVPNILQPGVIKELMMAEILGHDLIPQKDSADAKDKTGNTYEYLASIRRVGAMTNKGCSFQMDRICSGSMIPDTKIGDNVPPKDVYWGTKAEDVFLSSLATAQWIFGRV